MQSQRTTIYFLTLKFFDIMKTKKNATQVASERVVNLSVTEKNFSEIRETLKSGAKVQVNEIVTLASFLPNTETINASGKVTRTPFFYISADGTKYTSTTLKKLLNLQPEKKGQREETTFAKVWEQTKGLAKSAPLEELEEAIKVLQEIAKPLQEEKARKEREAQEWKEFQAWKARNKK